MAQTSNVPVVRGYPVVGNLFDLRNDRAGFALRIARDYGDIARMRVGIFPVLSVASPELAQEVLVEKESSFVKAPGLGIFARPLLGNGLLTSEHAFHRKQRKMMAPMFVQKRIAAYATEMASRAEKMAKRWKSGESIDVGAAMMELTLEIVGKTLFDAEIAAEAGEIGAALTIAMEHVISAISSFVPLPPSWPTPANRRNRRAIARLDETIYRMIAERRRTGEDKGDLLSMLLAAQEEGENGAPSGKGMDDKQVRDEAMTLFLAGHETTANALSWAWYLLAKHPAVYARMIAEIDAALGGRTPTFADLPKLPYTMQVFKETMRLYPPAYQTARRACEAVTIGGEEVKKGSIVLVNIIGMHHREKYFPRPYAFDPDRFTPEAEKARSKYAYLPFGAGARVCIGNHFALMEGQILLATIAQRVRFSLVSDRAIEAEPLVTLRPKHGVPVKVERRVIEN